MKISLLIWTLLLIIGGLITFQATGSPVMLVLPVAAILLYGALCPNPGALSEGARIVSALIMVAMFLIQFGGNISAVFIGMLSLPLYFAATQSVWEIMHSQTERDQTAPRVRLSVFSMAFYAALGTAALILRGGEDLRLLPVHGILAATLVVILAVSAWDLSRVLRLKKGETKDCLSGSQLIRRVLLGLGLAVAGAVLFAGVLPPAAEALAQLSPKLKMPGLEDQNFGPPHRPKERTTQNDPKSSNSFNPRFTGGPDRTARTGQCELPQRAELLRTDAPRIMVQFHDREEGLLLASHGELYIRSLTLAQYDNAAWTSASEEGFWQSDEQDGRKDGLVTLSNAPVGGQRHTVFVSDSDGYTLPALAGAAEFALPKIYVLPDDWHQIKTLGNIRYSARSHPKVWGNLSGVEAPRAAAPNLRYTNVPDGPLGEVLRKVSTEIFGGRRSLADVVPALQEFLSSQYQYSLKVENKNNLPALENFLLDERKGYCDFFATAATLLLRKADIPTRIAFGYAGGAFDAKTGVHVFRQRDAHSWTEINVEGQGWVICDFTPREAIADGSTEGEGGSDAGINLATFQDAAEAEKPPPAPEVQQLDENLLTQIRNLVPQLGPALLMLVGGGLVLALAGWVIFQRMKQRNSPEAKEKRASAARSRQPAYFLEFVKMVESLGIDHLPGDTLREMQAAMKAKSIYHPEFDDLAAYHYQVRYEDAPAEMERETGWLKLIRDFRRDREKAA